MSATPKKKTLGAGEWREIEDIFDRALSMPDDRRTAFIRFACRDRDSVAQEVLSLLKAHQESPDFLSQSPVPDIDKALERKAKILSTSSYSFQPRAVGKYTLLRR